jgi:hypothetical protein
METNDKDPKKKNAAEQEHTKPGKHHSSQGHSTGAKGTATTTGEPTLRSATTDSSRAPKNNNDDGPTGGNVR